MLALRAVPTSFTVARPCLKCRLYAEAWSRCRERIGQIGINFVSEIEKRGTFYAITLARARW